MRSPARLSGELGFYPLHNCVLKCNILSSSFNISEKTKGGYDLYYQFLLGWIKNEQKRKTSTMDQSLVLGHLLSAAKCIYSDGKCVIDKTVMEDSAISGLLRMPEERLDGSFCVREFYHRSIIEFLVAYELVEAFTEKNLIFIN